MGTINSISDLCFHFDVDATDPRWFQILNKTIYRNTSCGASISVYGTLPVEEIPEESRDQQLAAYRSRLLYSEYQRHLEAFSAAYNALDREGKSRVAAADLAMLEGRDEKPFIEWARTVVPDAFTNIPTPERLPVAFHYGHRADVPASFVMQSFTIQTIVEGSDAEITSDLFKVGAYTGEQVDNWIADMEAQADGLWHDANGVPRAPDEE